MSEPLPIPTLEGEKGGVYQHVVSRCTSDKALRMHSLWRCSSGSSTCCSRKKGLGLLPIVAAERETSAAAKPHCTSTSDPTVTGRPLAVGN